MKHGVSARFDQRVESLPSLGAWIETTSGRRRRSLRDSRSLHWERGLKHIQPPAHHAENCRSLHWERGLKLDDIGATIDLLGRSLHWERGLKHGV